MTTADLVIRGGKVVSPDSVIEASVAIKDGADHRGRRRRGDAAGTRDARRARAARAARRDRRARAFPRSRLSAQGGLRRAARRRRRSAASPPCSTCRTPSRRPARRRCSPPSTTWPPRRRTSISGSTACSARTRSSTCPSWSRAASSASSSTWATPSARSRRRRPARCWKPSRWWRRPASASRCTPRPIRSWSGARPGCATPAASIRWRIIASRPAVVAIEAVSRAAILAEWTGARIHILHISSAEELRPLREAKARGVDITGETCPQYLLLSTDDYARFGGVIRVNPPVREARNQAAAVGRARRRHHRHDRDRPRAAFARGKDAQRHLDRRLRLSRRRDADAADADRGQCRAAAASRDYVRWSAANPAKIWGLYPRKGVDRSPAPTPTSRWSISAREWTIDDAKLQSRSKITPLHGRPVKGLPIHTLVRGRFVMRDRALVPDTRGWGRSVHTIQHMPAAAPRNADQTMEAIVRGRQPRAIGKGAHDARAQPPNRQTRRRRLRRTARR